jgi:hypothetical protein
MADWKDNLLEDDARIGALVRSARRVAVLGIKTEEKADQAAYYVAKFVADHGGEVIPVPVFYPDVTEILGQKVYRKVADVPGPVDIVDVFRKPSDIDAHVDDLIAKKPRAAWFQLGIRNDAAAERLARAGIQVVQDRCLKVEWARFR